jgi:hypothetical protein
VWANVGHSQGLEGGVVAMGRYEGVEDAEVCLLIPVTN